MNQQEHTPSREPDRAIWETGVYVEQRREGERPVNMGIDWPLILSPSNDWLIL